MRCNNTYFNIALQNNHFTIRAKRLYLLSINLRFGCLWLTSALTHFNCDNNILYSNSQGFLIETFQQTAIRMNEKVDENHKKTLFRIFEWSHANASAIKNRRISLNIDFCLNILLPFLIDIICEYDYYLLRIPTTSVHFIWFYSYFQQDFAKLKMKVSLIGILIFNELIIRRFIDGLIH